MERCSFLLYDDNNVVFFFFCHFCDVLLHELCIYKITEIPECKPAGCI